MARSAGTTGLWALGVGIALLGLGFPLTCGGPESNGVAATQPGADAADSTQAARLIEAARGAHPVICGLAARALDRGWWGDGLRIEPAVSDEPVSREVVDWTLAVREGDGAVGPLAAVLADPDPCVRRLAARVLGRTESPEAAAALRWALDASSPGEREMAAVGLGFAGDDAAVAELVGALRDTEPKVRVAAAWALGQIESPDAIPPLAEALARDREAEVREAAAWALGEIE
ncbi:MAG TPA: HEAT repeat domain-containing protein [Gemmatimonadota bacterium]|nr:HEAT repeat domain-containing protein [Gemmatimonadota bacterium]